MTLEYRLDEAAAEVARAASDWPLSAADLHELVVAFHRAESLAEGAIGSALAEVQPEHREALLEQLADEQRHVAVFARWLGDQPPDLGAPSTARRPAPVWYALLLVNEVAGFCQFEMLASLLASSAPERAAEVRDIAADERRHIARLLGWLQPYRQRRGGRADFQRQLEGLVARFERGLPHRMLQFLPREGLAPLREAVVLAIARLLGLLLTSGREPLLAGGASRTPATPRAHRAGGEPPPLP